MKRHGDKEVDETCAQKKMLKYYELTEVFGTGQYGTYESCNGATHVTKNDDQNNKSTTAIELCTPERSVEKCR